MSIIFQSVQKEHIKGTAKDMDHFRKLNRLAGGTLKVISGPLTKEAQAAVSSAVEGAAPKAAKAPKGADKK